MEEAVIIIWVAEALVLGRAGLSGYLFGISHRHQYWRQRFGTVF